jgi:hypothetical protein
MSAQYSSKLPTSEDAINNFDELAHKLLDLDESIISCTIVSPLGEILSIKYKPSVESLKPNKELLDRGGSLVATLSAMVRQAEGQYGDNKYITLAYDKIEVEVISIKKKRLIVALGTTPLAPAREIAQKVTKIVDNE